MWPSQKSWTLLQSYSNYEWQITEFYILFSVNTAFWLVNIRRNNSNCCWPACLPNLVTSLFWFCLTLFCVHSLWNKRLCLLIRNSRISTRRTVAKKKKSVVEDVRNWMQFFRRCFSQDRRIIKGLGDQVTLLQSRGRLSPSGVKGWVTMRPKASSLFSAVFSSDLIFIYRKVASSRLWWLVALPRIFRLFMKETFDSYVLWPLDKMVQNWIV